MQKRRKLSLQRETLRSLDTRELRWAHGGNVAPTQQDCNTMAEDCEGTTGPSDPVEVFIPETYTIGPTTTVTVLPDP